jgi:hypothetical protein
MFTFFAKVIPSFSKKVNILNYSPYICGVGVLFFKKAEIIPVERRQVMLPTETFRLIAVYFLLIIA